MKKVIIIESTLLFLLAILILTDLLGITWSKKEILISCQPNEINYESFDPYCVSIIKSQQTFGSEYYIWVAKKIEPSYGHSVSYPDTDITNEQEIKDTKINWGNDGIEIETHLNTKVSIPKKNFIGGR